MDNSVRCSEILQELRKFAIMMILTSIIFSGQCDKPLIAEFLLMLFLKNTSSVSLHDLFRVSRENITNSTFSASI